MIKVRYINTDNLNAYGEEGTVKESNILKHQRTGEILGYEVDWLYRDDLQKVVTKDEVEIIT